MGIKLNTEDINVDGETYTLREIIVVDLEECLRSVKELVDKVQTIKSLADGDSCRELFERYTRYPITVEEGNRIRRDTKRNRKKLTDGVITEARLLRKFARLYMMKKGMWLTLRLRVI